MIATKSPSLHFQVVVASTREDGPRAFDHADLQALAKSQTYSHPIVVLDGFDNTKKLGFAHGFVVVGDELHADVIVSTDIRGRYAVPGYLLRDDGSVQLWCLGVTDIPEDTTLPAIKAAM